MSITLDKSYVMSTLLNIILRLISIQISWETHLPTTQTCPYGQMTLSFVYMNNYTNKRSLLSSKVSSWGNSPPSSDDFISKFIL